MKNKNYAKPAIFVSGIIILMVGLAVWGFGEGRGTFSNYDEDTPDAIIGSKTPYEYAQLHIDNVAREMKNAEWADISVIDTRIDKFELIGRLDQYELWALNFAMQVEDDTNTRWGTFSPDEDGWLCRATAFNDGNTHLVFLRDIGGVHLIGDVNWNAALRAFPPDCPWSAELFLRNFLEDWEYIPSVKFPDSDHLLVYFVLGNTDTHSPLSLYGRLLLSQPFGVDSIWVVDRMQHVGVRIFREPEILPMAQTMFAIPRCHESTMMDYFTELQRRFEAGETWLSDPYAVAQAELELHYGFDTRTITAIRSVTSCAWAYDNGR